MSYMHKVVRNGKKYAYYRRDVGSINALEHKRLSLTDQKIRQCLRCEENFMSKSIENKICNSCKDLFRESDEFKEYL